MTPSGSFAAGPGAEPTTRPGAVRPEWESVGEALAVRSYAVVEHCRAAGRDLAERGVSARDALGELRSTTRLVARRDPSFDEYEAVVDAWADATLGYLNRVGCADPLTGLDAQAHLVTLLGAPDAADLIMVALEVAEPEDFFAHSRRLSLLGDLCRGVFPSARSTARVGVRRLVTLTAAPSDLGARVALLARGAIGAERVWVEPVPLRGPARTALVDRLARH